MQDASVDRLSRIISEPRHDKGVGPKRPIPSSFRLHLTLAEGWFSLVLLAIVVYSTIWSVQAAGWVAHLEVLTLTTALGLLCGLIAAKQRRLPRLLVNAVALIAGLLLAMWQTAGADYAGSVPALINGFRLWFQIALAGQTSSDDSIFLFFIIALSFLLAYTSAWLLYRTRSPWLMIIANAVVLLINLSNIEPGFVVFLIVFLVAALLLLLRFNLYESSVRWKRQGLRTSDDLGWEFMQAGALVSIGILVLTWLLPWGYINDSAAQVWSADNNPWVQLENTWNRLVSVSGGYNPANHGNFADALTLGGNPNLTDDIVFTVKSDTDGPYLETLSYDTYSGHGWSNGATEVIPLRAGDPASIQSIYQRVVTQQITVVNPPGVQNAYLPGASEIYSSNQAAKVVYRRSDGSVVTWLRASGRLVAGDRYTVTSFVSSADVATLKTVPFPKDAPLYTPSRPDEQAPVNWYDPNVLKTYLQLPKNLDPNILALAKQITAGSRSMYDQAVALESYLHTFTYDTNINLPAGDEAVSWFLFRSGHRGFCNYFATTMAVMARELGMPSRVVVGYTNGKLDTKTHQWVIRGTEAHAWTQIYFAGYGWINFEPSASFASFTRPQHTTNSGVPSLTPGGSGTPANGKAHTPRDPSLVGNDNSTGLSLNGTNDVGAQIRQDVGIALFTLIALIAVGLLFFSVWWRRLFRSYGLPAQMFGRLTLVASWAGVSLQRSQTPYEYAHAVSEVVPDSSVAIERLADIYVRDRWADPSSDEHPRHNGEVGQLSSMWKTLQPRLFLHVLRHPYFLLSLPGRAVKFFRQRRARRRSRRPDDIVVPE